MASPKTKPSKHHVLFANQAKSEARLIRGPDNRNQERAMLAITIAFSVILLWSLYVLLVPDNLLRLIPAEANPGRIIVGDAKPADLNSGILNAQLALFSALVFLVGFCVTSWQIIRASTTRREDDEWKALEFVGNEFKSFTQDGNVISVKRIVESIDTTYKPKILSGQNSSEEKWIEITRKQVRNGLTSDDKRDADDGFFILDTSTSTWRHDKTDHADEENAVAYNFDQLCTHLLSIERLLEHKSWIIGDFRALVHYWAEKLCGLSTMDAVQDRYPETNDEATIEHWLVASLFDLCQFPTEADGDALGEWASDFFAAGMQSGMAREQLRCHALMVQYFAEYYASPGSDDIVLFLSNLVLSSQLMADLTNGPHLGSQPRILPKLVAGAPVSDLINQELARAKESAGKHVPIASVSNEHFDQTKDDLLDETAKLLTLATIGMETLGDRPESMPAFKKFLLLAYWRSIFRLGCWIRNEDGEPESGGEAFDLQLKHGLIDLLTPHLKSRAAARKTAEQILNSMNSR